MATNRLSGETSPYLRQHAENPVDWYPWGNEAFAAARDSDRPILLSIGYSSCHWCHVMAHESFEDEGVAAVMNELFVNVKVDREERPDVDSIYMQAVQSMTGHGGWPLTVFLTPDGRPFYGGTYYPKEPRQGMPGFVQVLEAVDEAWRIRRGDLDAQAARFVEALGQTAALRPSHEPLSDEILHAAYASARSQHDPDLGGFGGAPKFPQAMTLDFLLRTYARNRSEETLGIVQVSLDAMMAGGIYDQVGGGFHRYSTDAAWLVPHFEKMLYDQALLAKVYLHAWQATGDDRYRRVVEETVGYVLRDLRHEEGGFFSAEDADSEGVEGKFYVWSLDELRQAAGEHADAVVEWFGATEAGNWEGTNILTAARRSAPRPAEVTATLPALYEARERRVRPGLDDKVLLAWNALFLDTLAEAAAVLGRDDWLDAARTNARFLVERMTDGNGRLLRSWQGGQARHLAYAEDYGALLEALLTMAEVDHPEWIDHARWVADGLLDLFHDPDHGGFFTTGVDAERLVARTKDLFDNATPAENSLAARGLFRLATLTGEPRYEQAGVGVLRLVRDAMSRHPTAFSYLLGALEWYLTSPIEIAVVAPDDVGASELWREAWRRHLPVSVRVGAGADDGAAATPLLADRGLLDGRPTAYVCERFACRQPVDEVGALTEQIDEALAARRA